MSKLIPLNSTTLRALNSSIAQAQHSPESDTFSTPLSTPTMSSSSSSVSVNADEASETDNLDRPTLRKRTSRPSSLHIDNGHKKWTSDLSLEENSPEYHTASQTSSPTDAMITNANGSSHKQAASTVPMRNPLTLQAGSSPSNHSPSAHNMPESHKKQHNLPPKSPCFVHSHLDKGASLADWLRMRTADVALAKSLEGATNGKPGPLSRMSSSDFGISTPYESSSPSEFDDDDDGAGSVTRKLVETAVGVREMSKQLGRARVRSQIQNILIITKARDNRLIKLTREIALYLMKKPRYSNDRGLVVYVDNQLRYSKRFDAAGIQRDFPELFVPLPRRRSSSSNSLSSMTSTQREDYQFVEEGQLRYWTSEMCSRSPHLFDFVVTLGGDGTVLFTSWLFQRIVPPVLPFALGSLGFLTNFDFADHVAVMDSAIDNGIRVNLRMRFTCTVYRAVAPEGDKHRRAIKKSETGEILMRNVEKGGWEALEGGWSGVGNVEKDVNGKDFSPCAKDKEIMCFTTRPVESFEVLNDLVVDRGPSPYVSLLELFGDEHHMTTVQADGLTISTPTGSTAYSLSAGGSLVHPEIPAILITPICPHTLSFRPMLLPDSMELRICVPFNSRSTAWASFDGRGRVELKQGDHIKVTASKFPFPTVCADNQSTDWFNSISRTLKWNERERQKSFVVVEEGPAQPKARKNKVHQGSKLKPEAVDEAEEEDEVSDEEEDDERFDIDDSSPEASLHAPPADEVVFEVGKEKALELLEPTARDAAIALAKGSPTSFRPRSLSRTRSGIETPDRFACPHPHPPTISPRHVQWAEDNNKYSSSDLPAHSAQNGDRDHIHNPQLLSGGKSRIPRDRDVDADSMKTPTVADGLRKHHRTGSREHDGSQSRAFAVWGQDESDSNTSDSDV